jgi:two-component system cell cycle sensor histidine kinase/response regulator CckA
MRNLRILPVLLAAAASLGAAWTYSGIQGLALAALGISLLLLFVLLSRGRRAERVLQETEDRFLKAVGDTQAAERRLRVVEAHLLQSRKMEAVGRLAGGIAHDFNNLLTAINGYAELIGSRLPPSDPNRPMLEEIRRAGDRAAAITRQLLTFSRKQLISPVDLDLNAMLRDLERMLGRLLGSDIELSFDLDPDPASIHADPGQVGQAILNLALNAKDAMPEGGRLALSTSRATLDGSEEGYYLKPAPGDYICLAVEDTGKGMDETVKEHLFEPFFSTKSNPGRERGDSVRGAGLGLSMVYGILDQAKGGIRIRTEEGKGTVFLVYFPVSPAMDWDARLASPPAPSSRRREETVLVVEDEENVRRMVGSVLRGQGYHVLEASGAREALFTHENHAGPIHVLLTDVIMPGRSGREVALELQRLRPGIRTIFMSGYTDDAMLRQGLEASRALFLGKPFTPSELLRKLAEAEVLTPSPAG